MAERLEIDTRALHLDTQEIENSAAALNNNIADMFDEVTEMNAMWKGQSNQAYNEQFRIDYQTVQEILSDLKKYINELYEAEKDYNRCEEQVGEIVHSIRI